MDKDFPFGTEFSEVSHSLCIDQLWVSVSCPVLVKFSIAVKRHHDYNSYKGKHLLGVIPLQFRCSVHFCHGTKQGSKYAGRYGAGEGAECSTSLDVGNRKWFVSLGIV